MSVWLKYIADDLQVNINFVKRNFEKETDAESNDMSEGTPSELHNLSHSGNWKYKYMMKYTNKLLKIESNLNSIESDLVNNFIGNGEGINAKNEDGLTALHISSNNGNWKY